MRSKSYTINKVKVSVIELNVQSLLLIQKKSMETQPWAAFGKHNLGLIMNIE